jgi:hypothetical protein
VPEVIVVGAGLAGLSCATHLTRAGVDVVVQEASDTVGGRVRTDVVDGVLLDRGFQVHNTGYPEARRMLDHDRLELRLFAAGALIRVGDRLHPVGDPRRQPAWLLKTATAPIGSLADKAAVVALAARAALTPVPRLLAAPERSTYDHLRAHHLSDTSIDRFLRPFLSGVFLEEDLSTSSHFFDMVWRSFARGNQAVPARGMRAIPQQLADGLPAGVLQLSSPVSRLPTARAVVVATDASSAARLVPGLTAPNFRRVTTHYHLADAVPLQDKAILLDGDRSGPVTNSVVLTNVAPSYAPGRVLVSSSVVTGDSSEPAVRSHLASLYGVSTSGWQHVAAYDLPEALPSMAPPLGDLRKPVRLADGLYVCGDHRDTASIQGALVSGRRAATAVLKDLRR